MAQVFLVLKCYQCEMFQVQQRKKTNKWQCKVCNAKQSITKVHGEGVAADCRKHVQKLNMSQAAAAAARYPPIPQINPADLYDNATSSSDDSPHQTEKKFSVVGEGNRSKWAAFIDPAAASDDSEGDGDECYEVKTTDQGQVYRRMLQDSTGHQSTVSNERKQLSKKARLTGFDPVSGSGCSSNNSKTTVHPYSTVTEDMHTVIKSSQIELVPKKLTSSQSDNSVLRETPHGIYRSLNEERKEAISKSIGDLKVKEHSGTISSSKWSKFLPS